MKYGLKVYLNQVALGLSLVVLVFSVWVSIRSRNKANQVVAKTTEIYRQRAFTYLEYMHLPNAVEKVEFKRRLGAAKDLDALKIIIKEAEVRSNSNQIFDADMSRIKE